MSAVTGDAFRLIVVTAGAFGPEIGESFTGVGEASADDSPLLGDRVGELFAASALFLIC